MSCLVLFGLLLLIGGAGVIWRGYMGDGLFGIATGLAVLWFASADLRDEWFSPHSNPVDTKILSQTNDGRGRPVIRVQACNSREAGKLIDRTSFSGGHWVVTHTAKDEYTIHVEDNL